MALVDIEVQGNNFRVIAQEFCTMWLPDTPANRKIAIVMLRGLEDRAGNNLFTHKELANIVDSTRAQAASQHIEDFNECGRDFQAMLEGKRKRKVSREVVDGVLSVLRLSPLESEQEIADKVNQALERDDIKGHNVSAALEQISCKQIRSILKKRLAEGQAHYKEEALISRLFEMVINHGDEGDTLAASKLLPPEQATEALAGYQKEEQQLPDNVESLFTSEQEISQKDISDIWQGKLGWLLLSFTLYFQGVSLSVIGGWLGVNKSTVCRWLTKVSQWADFWFTQQVTAFSDKLGIDEKWIKIDDCWWYLFVAVDCVTRYPLHVSLYPSNSGYYCKLFLTEMKLKGLSPKLIITDGWDGYIKPIREVFPQAEHALCRFHVIKSIYRRLRKAHIFDLNISVMVANLFRTRYKRTVDRRIAKLEEELEPSQVDPVLSGLHAKLPQVRKAVGSTWRPSTVNCVEQFFSRFERFYRLKGPFCDEASANKHIRLFLLGYLFSIKANGRPCPLESAGCDVAKIPFYHLFNRPNLIALKQRITELHRNSA